MMQIPGLRMRSSAAIVRAGLGDAASDLATFHATVTTGDMYLVAQEWDNAVMAYQAAGSMGVSTVGPDIDSKTGGASKTLTSDAWTINGSLAAITTPATQQTAMTAQGFAQKMGSLYDQAINIPPPLPPPPTPSPTTSPAPTMTLAPTNPPVSNAGTNYTAPILIGAGAVGVGIVGWAAYKRWGRRGRGARENPVGERLTYKQRSRLPSSAFALPELRRNGKGGLPLTNKSGRLDPKHIRNAASRLAQMKKRGAVTAAQYRRAKTKIIRAACKTGVEKTCRTHLA